MSDPGSDRADPASLTYGVRITYYRLVTQAAPGLVALLLVLQSDLSPEALRPFVKNPEWPSLIAIGLPVLLLALPAGFALSGVSFFTLGGAVFSLRDWMWSNRLWRPVVSTLARSVGEPRINEANLSAKERTRYLNDVGFILRKHAFRGPREDAPDKVIAVAIFARSSALLLGLYGCLRICGLIGEAGNLSDRAEGGLIVGLFFLFIVFAAVFELYRDYTLAVAADQFQDYHEFDADAGREQEAIRKARETYAGDSGASNQRCA